MLDFNAINEALRRRAGQAPSGAGIPGGMPATQSPMMSNPSAQMGTTNAPMPDVPQGFPPTGSNPSTGPVDALNKSQPGEAQMILKALISRLGNLNKAPEQNGI